MLQGLVLNVSLARLAGVAAPVGESILTLLGGALGRDLWAQGRTAASLGIDDLEAAHDTALRGFARDAT